VRGGTARVARRRGGQRVATVCRAGEMGARGELKWHQGGVVWLSPWAHGGFGLGTRRVVVQVAGAGIRLCR